jgi:hypothetical protein
MTQPSAETTAGYDPRTGAFHVHHDWSGGESLTELVVCSVAAVAGLEPMDVDPISTRVDTDALESLFAVDDAPAGESAVTFRLNDCRVTVYGDGEVTIRPSDRFW